MTPQFKISGRVIEKETGRALRGFTVKAYDKDFLFDDLVGVASTDEAGHFFISYSLKDFAELFERRPDLYFVVYAHETHPPIHTTLDAIRWNAGQDESVEIAVPRHKVPVPGGGTEQIEFFDAQHRGGSEFEAGDSLLVSVGALEPDRSYQLRLLDGEHREILTASMIANRFGMIAPTILWPDMGIGIPDKGGRYAFENYEEAQRALGEQTLTLQLLDDGKLKRSGEIRIRNDASARRLFPASLTGGLRRGLLLGEDDLRVVGRNFPAGAHVDLYLVPRRLNWRAGDAFTPVQRKRGGDVQTTVQLSDSASSFSVVLAERDDLLPGSYDILARITRPGEYLREQRRLRETDFISERLMTTLVVRDDIFRYKPIKQGCVMMQKEIAAKMLWGVPEEIEYTNNFPVGTDVWASLDPAGLMPGAIGKKVRYYVVQHKTAAQWSADSSLVNIPTTTPEVITSPSCVNANAALVWSNPTQVGQYDLVVDFGNDAPDPSNYIPDGHFNPPTDMIDGYMTVGFHVTRDPSLPGTFAVGQTSFNDPAVTIPAVGVWAPPPQNLWGNTPSGTLSLPLTAEVRYPAAIAGMNVPVSAAQANYPVVVVMHGMHTSADPSHLGYNYLLDHLASHGFIAVSIDCNAINDINGTQDTRAHAMLEHIALLDSKNSNPGLFSGKIDMTRIGIMGHSRGGDGVVQAEVLNQSMALGRNIKAVVALAPTDFSGISPSPLNLTSSKFLCIYGSNDGDVWGGSGPATQYTGTGFRFYDRASVEKAMVFIYGATHNRFNTEWGTEWKVDSASPKILSVTQHQNLLRGYMTAFMQVHLQGRAEQRDYFNGTLKIPQASGVEVHCQYKPQSVLPLDSFESAPAINQNSLGGNVNHASLDGPPAEDVMAALDANSPHQTRGLRLKWNSAAAVYHSELPAGQRNVSSWKFLSFRVAQKVGSAANPANQARDFRVRLSTAGAGPSRAVRAGYFDAIPFPYKPEYITAFDASEGPNTKAALKTVRIPLYAWTIKCLNVPIVDLTNVESVSFEFDYDASGELEIDDIEFTE
jgi:hypothetical protein